MKVYHRSLYLAFLLFFFPRITMGQENSFTHYDMQRGLVGNTVYGMTQDRDGYIWFGTETGLSRFDGDKFRNYTMEDGLPGNQVFGLYTDTKNRTWIATFKNEVCFYANGRIHNTKNDTTLKKIALKNHVIRMTEDLYGNMLFNCYKTCYLLKSNGEVRSVPTAFPSDIQSFFYPVSGMLNVNIDLVKIPEYVRQKIAGKLLMIPLLGTNSVGTASRYAAHNLVLKAIAQDTMFYFPVADTVCQFINLPYKTTHVKQVNSYMYAFIRRYNGVTLFNADSPGLTRDYFAGYPVNNVLEDKDKNLWFSTHGSGVFKIDNTKFKNFSFGGLGVDYIESVNNKIYIGTDSGKLWSITPLADTFRETINNKKTKRIACSLKDLIACKGIGYINCANSDFLNMEKINVKIGSIKTIQYNSDTFLIASANGCLLFSLADYRLLKTIYQGHVTCAYKKDGVAYVGTIESLHKISLKRQENEPSDQILLNSQISQMTEAPDGALWLTSYEHGLICYKGGHITARIRRRNGLASDICNCIFISGNSLWVGTNNGLNKIDTRSGVPVVVRHLTQTDGLMSNIVNTVYVSGRYVYVGTAAGLTVFDEANLPAHAGCNLKIERVFVSGKKKNLSNTGLILPYNSNNIQFDLSSISFLPGAPPILQYRLLGLSTGWQTSEEKTLKYPSLPSGKYMLQVRAVNKLGDKSPLVNYRFEIRKALWEKWWFWFLILSVIIILTALGVRAIITRSYFIRKEKLLSAQKIMALEQMALRAQMNPHFIFNSLNSLQQHIISQDVRKANNYLSHFAALVRQTLDNAQKIYIPVAEEIAFLKNYLELEMQQSLGAFTYTITVDPEIDQEDMLIPNMVLQPYIENAVKHGVRKLKSGGIITVSLRLREHFLECVICDNGPGISFTGATGKMHQDTSVAHGMSITEKRILTINQLNQGLKDIFVKVEDSKTLDPSARGTKVTILFPV